MGHKESYIITDSSCMLSVAFGMPVCQFAISNDIMNYPSNTWSKNMIFFLHNQKLFIVWNVYFQVLSLFDPLLQIILVSVGDDALDIDETPSFLHLQSTCNTDGTKVSQEPNRRKKDWWSFLMLSKNTLSWYNIDTEKGFYRQKMIKCHGDSCQQENCTNCLPW